MLLVPCRINSRLPVAKVSLLVPHRLSWVSCCILSPKRTVDASRERERICIERLMKFVNFIPPCIDVQLPICLQLAFTCLLVSPWAKAVDLLDTFMLCFEPVSVFCPVFR